MHFSPITINKQFLIYAIKKSIYRIGLYTSLYYSLIGAYQFFNLLRNCNYQTFRYYWFQFLLKFSYIQQQISNKQQKIVSNIRSDLNHYIVDNKLPVYTKLEDSSESSDVIQKQIQDSIIKKFDWTQGKVSGTIYTSVTKQMQSLMTSVFPYYYLSNPLHPDIFPGLRKMEAAIISIPK